MRDEEFDQACRFLSELAAAVQRHGVSSHSMEALLVRVAHAMGLHGEFLATPTQVQSILWRENEDRQRLHVTVSAAGNFDLTKLAEISELTDQVESGEITPAAGSERLRAIEGAAPRHGPGLDAVGFVLCGLGFGVVLGISWVDVLLGGVLSLLSFGLTRMAARSQGLTTALELVTATAASSLATLLCLVFPGSNPLAVCVCALIYFIPGFGFTLGASELMIGNTLSGLIGFTRAAVTSGKLLVGALIGTALVRGGVAVPPADLEDGVAHGWTWLFVPVLVLGLSLLFRVRRSDLIWPVLGGLLVWTGVNLGSELGFWQGTFLGAFILAFGSQFFARKSGLPSSIIVLPAVMVLVPGLSTLRAVYVADTQGFVEGVRVAYQVVVLIAAILGGLLVGNAAWAIRRPLSRLGLLPHEARPN